MVDHLLQVVLSDLTGGGTKLPTGGASKRVGGGGQSVYMLKEALLGEMSAT